MEYKQTLILDYSTWRCGGPQGDNVLGKGDTFLRNKEGFMCCLGQFSLQVKPELTVDKISEIGEPFSLREEIPGLGWYDDDIDEWANTQLSDDAMAINDSTQTTPEHKIELLKDLFATEGYEITVINKP